MNLIKCDLCGKSGNAVKYSVATCEDRHINLWPQHFGGGGQFRLTWVKNSKNWSMVESICPACRGKMERFLVKMIENKKS